MTILTEPQKKVRWSDCQIGHSKNELFEKLTQLHFIIEGIITQKKTFKKSPASRGGYL